MNIKVRSHETERVNQIIYFILYLVRKQKNNLSWTVVKQDAMEKRLFFLSTKEVKTIRNPEEWQGVNHDTIRMDRLDDSNALG